MKTFSKNESNLNKENGRREETILTKKEIGRRGEEIAAEFLERKGLQIVERNFHSRWGELDLIAVKINESDYENEMYFDETAEGMYAGAMIGQGNGVHFVDVPSTVTILRSGAAISARNRLTPQYMGFL